MNTISTTSITKSFGETKALSDISLNVIQGEIYGFIGLNGAGKTTLIRVLLGMITPDQGSVKLLGTDLSLNFQYWNQIGYLVETPNAYPELTVKENLNVFYKLRQLNNKNLVSDIIEKLKLSKYENVKSKNLSLGNKQRLGLAKAMMHKPKLLILDEPINGLDPEGIVEVRELLRNLAADGSTIFLSSHLLDEMSRLVDTIAVINSGKLIRELTTIQLGNELK